MALNVIDYRKEFNDSLDGFAKIGLEEMNKARLMRRIDNKFLLTMDQLNMLIKPLSDSFSILEINNSLNQNYTSFYYDTHDLDMYMNHHNRRVNRYKIRQRIYHSSGDSFLEIKFKNNKGVTKKTRVETQCEFKKIPYECYDFVSENSSYNGLMLKRTLENNFDRFTLTNKKRNQRITIDTNLSFWYKNKPLVLPNLVIAEVKSTRDDIDRTIFQLFKDYNIHATGMSKYSISMAMLVPGIKQNLFKQKINTINKLCYVY